ncbi:hypothetical protein HELRODRAFT_193000, partial [Helobdella robusta]|uniref:Uncharacterized protein n=1 Tax=Helobdella robusta TaxID=6412 RepID=T1FUI0_HELRO
MMYFLIKTFVCLSTFFMLIVHTEDSLKPKPRKSISKQEALISTLINEGYSKNDPPSTVDATEVKLGIRINSFYSISESTM